MDKAWEGNYAKGYIDGFLAATEEHKAKEEKPYFDVEDIMKRYNVGTSKAYNILRAVRRCCNGGKLLSAGSVLKSELLYWESIVEKNFVERL